MKRLTYKLDEPIETKLLHYDYKRIADYDISRGNFGRITDADIYNKLGQLEDIEEKLGIDLITLFKAVKNGIWIKKQGTDKPLLFFYETVLLCEGYLYACPIDVYDERVSIDKYGKTWALTKEELERRK